MMPSLHPTVLRHLQMVQRSTQVGLHAFLRRNHETVRSPRTVYRWHQRLGDTLLVIPSITVERLGLVHLHVFVTEPGEEWFRFKYAVEACWVSPDLCHDALYLHCLVPSDAKTTVLSLLRTLPCAEYQSVWSGSGWQQFFTSQDEPLELPVADSPETSDVLRRYPFIVPTIMESWIYRNSLALQWHRARNRLGNRVREFLPRTRIHTVNGAQHVSGAYAALASEGLIRQHVVRYHPLLAVSVEVFLHVTLDRGALYEMLCVVRTSVHAIESYPTVDGYFVRLLGPHRLLDAITSLPASVRQSCTLLFFHTKRHPTPHVRFAYEDLFDPKTGTWRDA